MAIAVSSCCDATLLLDVGALGIFQKRREFHRPSVNEDSWSMVLKEANVLQEGS